MNNFFFLGKRNKHRSFLPIKIIFNRRFNLFAYPFKYTHTYARARDIDVSTLFTRSIIDIKKEKKLLQSIKQRGETYITL